MIERELVEEMAKRYVDTFNKIYGLAVEEQSLTDIFSDFGNEVCDMIDFVNRYRRYLEMSREAFEQATHIKSRYDSGEYHYYPDKGEDTLKARLSYIEYLTKDKGYAL